MSDPSARTFSGDFKRFFLRGLVILLPSVLTLWIVVKAYQFIDNTIAEPINRGVRVAMVNGARVWEPLQSAFNPTGERNPEWQVLLDWGATATELDSARGKFRQQNIQLWWTEHQWYMDLIGLGVAIIAVYISGRLLGGFFGRQIYRKLESLITSIPVVKQVYPYVKQIVDFLFSDEQPIKFNRVVAVEYPRKGIWSVGFLTGGTMKALRKKSQEGVTVFIPSSPTPFTGYTITVPWSELIELPISVEEAIRFAVSGGVLVPDHQRVPGEEPAGSAEASPGLISLGVDAAAPPHEPTTPDGEAEEPPPVAGRRPGKAAPRTTG